MPSLIEVKKQIQATQNTKKITKAMQLVAASKMKTFQRTSAHVREHAEGLLHALRLAHASMQESAFGEERSNGKQLFILLTSDKGLCGAMNQRLIRTLFQSKEWNETPEHERLLITVGRKSAEAARREGVTPTKAFQQLPEKLTPFDALQVIDAILTTWTTEDVQNVFLISPKYVNPFVFHPQIKAYLPLSEEMAQDQLATPDAEIESQKSETPVEAAFLEPSREEIVEKVASQVIESLFMAAFYELKATEYSSRMVAMKKATEAADDQIKLLTAKYNKARQSSITQQLAELASANEAMSGQNDQELFDA